MIRGITDFLARAFPPEVVTIMVATLPIAELRGAIPLALGVFRFTVPKAFILSVIGNFIPVIPVLLFLKSVSEWLGTRSKAAQRFFTWLFNRTRKRSAIVERLGIVGLMIFVAIPLPFTGAWTGCVAAFLLGIKRRLATIAILCGIMIAGVIVSLASIGMIKVLF